MTADRIATATSAELADQASATCSGTPPATT